MSPMARIERVVLLQAVPLFAHCRAEEILRISGIARELDLSTDQRLYERDDLPTAMYCVVRGAIAVTCEDGSQGRVGPGQSLGVEEILSGRRRLGAAWATIDSVLLEIPADDFFDLLAHNVEIIKSIFRHVLPERRGPGGAS